MSAGFLRLGVFAACVVAAGLASLAAGQDANWDLRNYHAYNAFAWLHGRLGHDMAPAQVQTYLNPLGDLPFHALVQVLPGPRSVAFAMALPTAVAGYFLWRLLAFLFPGRGRGRAFLVACAWAIGITAATGQAEIGSTMNEWTSAALVAAALGLAVPAVQEGLRRGLLLGAFLIGIAAGLKLTNACYAVGLVAAAASLGPGRVRGAAMAAAGCAAGIALAHGPWSLVLWREFASPVFPFFNAVFASEWFDSVNWHDRRFPAPAGVFEAIAWPLLFSRESSLVSEVQFRDYRLAALLVLGAVVAVRGRVRPQPSLANGRAWIFLVVFTTASYAAWLAVFRVHRYLLPLEVLSGALVVAAVARLAAWRPARYAAVAVVGAALVGTTRLPGWERIPFGESVFAVRVPPVEAAALVVLARDLPASYLVPFFPADARFVSPANNFLRAGMDNRLAWEAARAIRTHAGPRYLLEDRLGPARDEELAAAGIARVEGSCLPVRSNLDGDALRLCRARVAAP